MAAAAAAAFGLCSAFNQRQSWRVTADANRVVRPGNSERFAGSPNLFISLDIDVGGWGAARSGAARSGAATLRADGARSGAATLREMRSLQGITAHFHSSLIGFNDGV